MINRNEVLDALRNVSGVPHRSGQFKGRTIYEAGDYRGRGSGKYYMDFASFSGGTNQEIPLSIIHELESEGVIVRAFPDKPEIKAWVLSKGAR